MKQYKVRLNNVEGFQVTTKLSEGLQEGRLRSVTSFELGESTMQGVQPIYRQKVRFLARDSLIADRQDWQSLINNLISNQNVTYHQSSYNMPSGEVLSISEDNELFAKSHSFYHFRIRNYELYQEDVDEVNLPSFINAKYYDKFPGYEKARDLYTMNDMMSTGSRFLRQIPGCNLTYKLFNNHIIKHKNSNGLGGSEGVFVMEGNYFYDYATLNKTFDETENQRQKNIFMMFEYKSSFNNRVIEVPYFNLIQLEYTNSFTNSNRVKNAFNETDMAEILMSMLKNGVDDTVILNVNGTNTPVRIVDLVDSFTLNNSFSQVEREDETFLYNPDKSIFDNNNNVFAFTMKKLILLGKIRNIMISQQKKFSDFFPQKEQKPLYKEFIAYKIEKQKFVGSDFRTVQTFYSYSYDNVTSFIDSQVNLDQLYRYNVSAFFLICGHKVSFEDIRTCDMEESDFWYDDNTETTELADILSGARYGARATMVVEPSWKIAQIPLYSKSMRIVEPPPIEPKVTFRDVSGVNHKIKIVLNDPFEVNVFDNDRKPMVFFNESEQEYTDKLSTYAYTPNMYSTFAASDSVFDVYRLEEKPNSILDFSDALYHTVQSGEIDEFGDRDVMSSMFDYLEHQKKYYYIVRTRTHRNNLSNPSPIYVVEKFKDADETILKIETMTVDEPIAQSMESKFRRFMQVNIDERHLLVRSETYGNSTTAIANTNNISLGQNTPGYESIWSYNGEDTQNNNKYIKIRLESKRTGKKIDLNFYFKIQSPLLGGS